MISLALLPKGRVEEGIEYIKKLVKNLDEKMQPKWKKYFIYFDKQWMIRVGPDNFCVYGAPYRTNNCLESYHRNLKAMMGKSPHAIKFLSKYIFHLKIFNMIFIQYRFLQKYKKIVLG